MMFGKIASSTPTSKVSRLNSIPKTYTVMCTEADNVFWLESIFAALVSWFTLAGFFISPTVYQIRPGFLADSKESEFIRSTVGNSPLLAVPIILCVLGIGGECALWYKWRKNYVLLLRDIF
jgi:hypothetical protein